MYGKWLCTGMLNYRGTNPRDKSGFIPYGTQTIGSPSWEFEDSYPDWEKRFVEYNPYNRWSEMWRED